MKPSLKITGLHIEGLKAIRRLDWPADGMGWNGVVPDTIVIGGVNGSGKTTLIRFLASALRGIGERGVEIPGWPTDAKGRINFEINEHIAGGTFNGRILVDALEFVKNARDDHTRIFINRGDNRALLDGFSYDKVAYPPAELPTEQLPGVLFLPSDRRLEIPDDGYKAGAPITPSNHFFTTLEPVRNWKDSLEALLYSARWEDLNAKEEGKPEEARHFSAFAEAFHSFFEGTKKVIWRNARLVIQPAGTDAVHSLEDLSSGEKQVIILASQILYHYRPGSIVLIDEPELHFHTYWQAKLWTMLKGWQKERGGQIIIATQSNDLFRMADPGTRIILGGGWRE